MQVTWNPPHPHLRVLKKTPTYITYYTKVRVYSQFIHEDAPVSIPTLLFEDGVYVGPPDANYVNGVSYTEDEINRIRNFQHPYLRKTLLHQYS